LKLDPFFPSIFLIIVIITFSSPQVSFPTPVIPFGPPPKSVVPGLGPDRDLEEINKQFERINHMWDLIIKGDDLNRQARYQEAIPYFDEVLAINGTEAAALDGKGTALMGLGRYQEAIELYDKAINSDPTYLPPFNNKGLILYKLGNYQAAIELYDKELEVIGKVHIAGGGTLRITFVPKDSIEPLINKGAALSKLGRPQEAIEVYDKALALDPSNKDALNNKGNALSALGRHQEAIEVYDKALEIPDALSNSSTTHVEGLGDQHVGNMNNLVKVSAVTTGIYTNLDKDYIGLYYVASSKDSQIIVFIHVNKGIGLYDAARYDDANNDFDIALKINPNFAPSLYYKGLCLEKIRNVSDTEAISYKQRAHTIDPSYKGEKLDETLIQIKVKLPIEQLFTK
jgi:tetratricopeptide (TPR) repeat protein